jgi:hypothetical protein
MTATIREVIRLLAELPSNLRCSVRLSKVERRVVSITIPLTEAEKEARKKVKPGHWSDERDTRLRANRRAKLEAWLATGSLRKAAAICGCSTTRIAYVRDGEVRSRKSFLSKNPYRSEGYFDWMDAHFYGDPVTPERLLASDIVMYELGADTYCYSPDELVAAVRARSE